MTEPRTEAGRTALRMLAHEDYCPRTPPPGAATCGCPFCAEWRAALDHECGCTVLEHILAIESEAGGKE